jgi:ketosteroid isomerase-like protein
VTTPEDRLAFVETAVDAFNRRDMDWLHEHMSEDFEFASVLTAVDGVATYRGRDAWRDYFAALEDTWSEWDVENLGLHEGAGDSVAAVISLAGRGRLSGARTSQTIGITYEFRDDRIWRMHSYLDPDDALAAVGAS